MTARHAARPSDVDWASRIAERLPEADVLRLAAAAASGAGAVHALRAQAPGPVRDACDQVIAQLGGQVPAFAAGALLGAAAAVRRARARQSLDVVWTGPESGISTSRLTAATVPALEEALAGAARRRVEIVLVAERHADNPGYHGPDLPFPGIPATRLSWPAGRRPPGASLHAKAIVVDDEIALVTSANLTSRAMEANLECGILIRGGPQPRAIRDHVHALWSLGQLRRL